VLHQPRSTQRYESEPREDEPALAKGMLGVVRRRPRWGYRRVAWQLRQEGWRVSDTRVYRLCSKLHGLAVRLLVLSGAIFQT
jgi:putative transposase